MRVEMGWDDRSRRLHLRLATGSRMLQPEGILLSIGLAGSDQWKAVVFRGDPLAMAL
jgi:hypothetical protein